MVAVSLRDEHCEVCELPSIRRDGGVERQGAVEDRGACVSGWVVEHESSGEGGATAEADNRTGRPAGAAASSQVVNQSIVSRSDSAIGCPIPRLPNHANPPPSAMVLRLLRRRVPLRDALRVR